MYLLLFYTGIRKCPGYELANSEFYLLITSIVHRFKLIPDDEDSRPSLDNTQGIFAHPKPYRLKAVPFSDVIIEE
jgi:cytochrome P450